MPFIGSKEMVKDQETQGHSPNLVRFDERDPEDPIHWSERKKKAVVTNLCFLSFIS